MDVYSRVRSFKATGYQALANDYFARAGVTDPIQKANYNALFLELIAGGVDLNADFIYNFTAYNDTQAVTSLFNNFTATPVGLTGRFTPKVGVTFNGTGYLQSGYIPSTAFTGKKFALNNGSYGGKVIGAIATGYLLLISAYNPNPYDILGYRGLTGGDFFYIGINQVASIIDTNTVINTASLYTSIQVKRTSASARIFLYDANTYTPPSVNSSLLSPIEWFIGARNDMGTADLIAENNTGLSHVYAGNSSLSKSVIDTAISNFVSRMA